MFKRSLLCAMVLGMMSVGSLADAATDTKEVARKSEVPAPAKAGADATGNQGRSLLKQAILVLHGGKTASKMQSLASDDNPQCSRCHGD
ncbi:MAG: hypothetical protein JSR63_07010 [Proteobacteria bacterium]|nr:hypothetical protein [Pseudomonadota bacterium]MBS0217920.1 hypothetical protein [Pseudomonadota bacterium]